MKKPTALACLSFLFVSSPIFGKESHVPLDPLSIYEITCHSTDGMNIDVSVTGVGFYTGSLPKKYMTFNGERERIRTFRHYETVRYVSNTIHRFQARHADVQLTVDFLEGNALDSAKGRVFYEMAGTETFSPVDCTILSN